MSEYEDELLFELKRLKAKLDHCANRHFEQKERAARAEAELADLKEMAATDQRCAEALAEQGFLRTESLWDQVISALNALHDTKAELARVTAEAAVMREVLHFIQEPMPKPYCGYCDDCDAAVAATREALSSTSAGAGLLKRLEASEAVAEAAEKRFLTWNRDTYAGLAQAIEAWRKSKESP